MSAGTQITANLHSINPLIECDAWSEDSKINVQHSLDFLGDAVTAIENGGGFTKDTAHGFWLLQQTCIAALNISYSVKGGDQ